MILSFVLSVAGVSVQMPKRVNSSSVDEARTPPSGIDWTLGWVPRFWRSSMVVVNGDKTWV